ncbi:UDP-N-acetylenolpyruvoylglucosamine reductase [Candidatus Roizmanbacteria bacterium CG10_big_fil_rev_8_21_14_0_10_45_7]|uniref:UDP-N-acetylenolpyruvoylglucosamine reductase n=1 Tax=Candidatus Roizmanbacteria bacterium CG10_big_fil_rev_8_21_14_0_10_45_7 TaxID=1974854 RepID=A0A2M8KUL7_9BACT|nr:MAG: UDP-N-acetylenolpyruvoylglucosamine reductase [Candidatus Roizmanbacteria bacterium CG10_big_fil_rev_8_21_14_0_10_45_7]
MLPMPKAKQILQKNITIGTLRWDVPLSSLTTMRIGGPAWAMVQTDNVDEIRCVYDLVAQKEIPLFVLGGGSNVVFPDEGYPGIILKLPLGSISTEVRDKDRVAVTFSGGYLSQLAAQKTVDLGLTGFESMYGLPGTLGGAIVMNSKWPAGKFMTGDVLESVQYLRPDGSLTTMRHDELDFSYGHSSLQNKKGIVTQATFVFSQDDPKEGMRRCMEIMEYRKKTQPHGVKTAGCVFKNIGKNEQELHDLPYGSSGYLIDQAGLKGTRIGGLTVSTVHANFFVNDGTATYADYRALVEKVRQTVYDKFSVKLTEEVYAVHH